MARRVVRFRKNNPHMGPRFLRYYYGRKEKLPSEGAIYRIIEEAGLIKKHRRTKKTKARDMRRVKASLGAFEKCQVDVKDLSDIPNYSAFIKLAHYPRYQISFRCVRTGACFVSLMHSNNTVNSAVFAAVVLNHLKAFDLLPRVIQTGNGSEFVKIRAKNPDDPTLFRKVVQAFSVEHRTIPPGQKTYNSDVEAFHGLIEHEFYNVRKYPSLPLLMERLSSYMEFFNLKRMNWYKGKPPWGILKALIPKARKSSLLLRPFIIEEITPDISFPRGMSVEEMGVDCGDRLIRPRHVRPRCAPRRPELQFA